MSFILDALKRAERERTLGTRPDAYVPPILSAASEVRAPVWRTASFWAAVSALTGVMVGYIWLGSLQDTSSFEDIIPVAASAVHEPSRYAVNTHPAQASAALDAPSAPAAMTIAPVPQKSPVLQENRSTDRSTDNVSKPATGTIKKDTAPKTAGKKPNSSAVSTVPAVSTDALVTLRELPQHIQQEIPAISIDGYIYSTNPSDRSVVMNKKLLHEGAEVAPGLTLEKLTPDGAVLQYKGYRYRTAYR